MSSVQNLYETKRTAIGEFTQKNSAEYAGIEKADEIKRRAEEIMKNIARMIFGC